MGPYCNFCGSRCFVPTTREDPIKTDLKATCLKGKAHDLSKTFPVIYAKDGSDSKTGIVYGWMIELKRGEEYSRAAQILNGEAAEFSIRNKDLEEILDLTAAPGKNHYYRLND